MEEEVDAAKLLADKGLQRPDEADWPEWSGFIRVAWDELRDDRHVGDMGGIGRIYYTAIDRYALRYGLRGGEFDLFLMGLRALDEEFLRHVGERRKAEAEKRKNQQKT